MSDKAKLNEALAEFDEKGWMHVSLPTANVIADLLTSALADSLAKESS